MAVRCSEMRSEMSADAACSPAGAVTHSRSRSGSRSARCTPSSLRAARRPRLCSRSRRMRKAPSAARLTSARSPLTLQRAAPCEALALL
jgi:hypothetical protein